MPSDRENVTFYSSEERSKSSYFGSYVIMMKNILSSRELIVQLFKRDFFAAYKKSLLGIGWILIAPLIGVSSWIFMSMTGVLTPGDVGVPYPVYVLLGSSIWGLFMGFYTSAESTLSSGAGFILQVKYPHEALLVKQTAQNLANFLIGFALNLVVLLFFHVVPTWKIVFFPFMILPLFFLGAGMGLVMSVITVVSNEAQRGFSLILGLLIYATPIIYSSKIQNPLLQKIIYWNPLTYLVSAPRDVILTGKVDDLPKFFISSGVSFLIFIFSWRLFFISEEVVIEKMI